ncbi:MAG: nitrophenyl compound nitroreductase subunit ArsF family protein [Elusimicrobiota bacterium]
MRSKKVQAGILLLFVTCSVVYLTARSFSQPGPVEQNKEDQTPPPVTKRADSPRVIAYYFHGTARCYTCKKLEAYSEAALKAAFATELKTGSLEWRTVNIDEKKNQHFIKDYQLFTKALIVSVLADGKQLRWKNLDQIWQLVGDQEAFTEYVQSEVRATLKPDKK